MKRLGIRVPTPLGFAHLRPVEDSNFDEAVAMEDWADAQQGPNTYEA